MYIDKPAKRGVHTKVRQALEVYKKLHHGTVHPMRMEIIIQLEHTLDIITDSRQVYEALMRIIQTIPLYRTWFWIHIGSPSVLRSLLEDAMRATRDEDELEQLKNENAVLSKEIDTLKKDIVNMLSEHEKIILQLTREHYSELNLAKQELASIKHVVQKQLQLQEMKPNGLSALSF